MSTAKKRQAFEVIAEIEQKWRKRCRFAMWSWSVEHLEFLVARWAYKDPKASERQALFSQFILEGVEWRLLNKAPSHWLYMHKEHMRDLMQGAGLNTSEPEYVSKVTDFSVIELPKRQMVCVG